MFFCVIGFSQFAFSEAGSPVAEESLSRALPGVDPAPPVQSVGWGPATDEVGSDFRGGEIL